MVSSPSQVKSPISRIRPPTICARERDVGGKSKETLQFGAGRVHVHGTRPPRETNDDVVSEEPIHLFPVPPETSETTTYSRTRSQGKEKNVKEEFRKC